MQIIKISIKDSKNAEEEYGIIISKIRDAIFNILEKSYFIGRFNIQKGKLNIYIEKSEILKSLYEKD